MKENKVEIIDAIGESDESCVHFVKKISMGMLSDDMDMFVYGCSGVLRDLLSKILYSARRLDSTKSIVVA